MTTLKDLQIIIEDAVKKLDYPLHPADLYEPITYILSIGGKRLRPALVLMATDLFGGNINAAIPPALAIEVFHNFTLMHDDIMDNAPLRRGKVTVHKRWNQNVGILSGDAMLVEGYKLMMQVSDHILRPVMEIFNTTATAVCEGQQIDMQFEQQQNVQLNEYLEMIRLKTAVVLGGALKIGALIGGADQQNADLLYTFGEQLGIAFQLQDDILDVYGDPEKFGKQVGGDIMANKKTWLLIKALETADESNLSELNQWLDLSDFDADKKVAAVTRIYNSLNIKQSAYHAMQTYADAAYQALKDIDLPQERKQYLYEFADGLLIREN